ncbi:Distal rod protein [Legionella massiliensis]|uniref:Distal rod protein n=1 Tax=Legionella massiliensis TaxID=1034943 RepID=A0A078KVN5_9GAMM|nr:flagellar hook-basal body complex protein [Legionella massiliensis]CDZ77067.1 Distal rod protein [Legionella massiliensis]CEE12805.1 Flagellar basal-body rod protein FlgG [Legionella massiliensis]
MSNALTIAASGLKSQEYYIDKIAHDLANLNTPNYKASKIIFADVLYQNIDGSAPLFDKQSRAKIGLGAAVYKTSKDFSQGPLKTTNDWKNLAIDGNGFFQVINSDGNISYTRNSTFTVDEEHYLVTQDGLRLADNIQIPEDMVDINIKENGEVEAVLAGETEPQLLGSIKLAKFLEPEALNPIGTGLYNATEKTGDAIIDSPGSSGLGKLMPKQIEGSNVDMVNTLMQLTLAQRVYQLNAKAIQIADELEKMTNEIPN